MSLMNDLSGKGESLSAACSAFSTSVLPIQAVIFDVDGLMVDSEPLQTLAWDIYLRPFGHRIGPEEKALLLGRRVIESATLMKERLGLPGDADSIVAGRSPILFALIREKLRPMRGLFEVVAACRRLGLT